MKTPFTPDECWAALDFLCDVLGAKLRLHQHGRVSIQVPGRPQVQRLFPNAVTALSWVESVLVPASPAPPPRQRRQG
jgi:hypothetical protein